MMAQSILQVAFELRSARRANHPAAGKAGLASLLAIEHHWPGLPEPRRSPMRTRGLRFLVLATLALLVIRVTAAERGYYELFTENTNGPSHFIGNPNLVNTNNPGPTINTNIPFVKFRQGEIADIKLGMTMSEVVAAWGKPRQLVSRCGFGPRLWYGPGRWYGDISLSFRGDRLVLIGIGGETAKRLAFDNGLAGCAGRAEFEKVLGEPSVRDPKDSSLYNGEIAYRTRPFRTDFRFESGGVSPPKEHLHWASVRLEAEAQSDRRGEQSGLSQ
jgi:hypothetical protein